MGERLPLGFGSLNRFPERTILKLIFMLDVFQLVVNMNHSGLVSVCVLTFVCYDISTIIYFVVLGSSLYF